jgi:hypothetical protein
VILTLNLVIFNTCEAQLKECLVEKKEQRLLNFYKAFAILALLYGSECCTLTEHLESQIGTAEMRVLRAVADYRRTDNIRKQTDSN